MIQDKDLHYNMALYMAVMQEKYQNIKEKRKQLEKVLYVAASKIQKLVRKHLLRKKTRVAITLQRWWRRMQGQIRDKKQKIDRFKKLYYGLIIFKFFKKSYAKKPQPNLKKPKNNKKPRSKQPPTTPDLLTHLTQTFPNFITRKSALFAQSKYINKYRQYLKQKFEKDWQLYQTKLTKQLWKEINKKWVKIDKLKGQHKYLNQQDKEVDAEEYVGRKLNGIYEEFYGKLEETDRKLRRDSEEVMYALRVLEARYQEEILAKLGKQRGNSL